MPVAVVTGSGRGIGAAIALKLAKNGYDIVLNARNAPELRETAKEIEVLGRTALIIRGDIRDKRTIKKVIVSTMKKFGRIDVLVNNAGVDYVGTLLENKNSEIDAILDVNLRALIYCTKAALPIMIKQKSGIIINISSRAGKRAIPGFAVYSATKFGVIGFTQALAGEVEQFGVKVFAVCPSGTDTKMWRTLFPESAAPFVPEDVAIEVAELIKNADNVPLGSAIDVKKHV